MTPRHAPSITLCLVAWAVLSTTSFAIDVDLVAITAGAAREDGLLDEYFLSFTLEGADIAAARVVKPGSPPSQVCVLVDEGDGNWNCDLLGFNDLDEICTSIGFGDFTFELTAAVGADDELTVSFDPGCTDPITGFPAITAPAPGGTVPPVPEPDDFCWTCSAAGTCGVGDTAVSLFDNDSDLAVEVLRFVPAPACWDPGICIPTGFGYEFEVSALVIYADFEPRQTDLGDELTYVSAFENQNLTTFDVTDAVPTTPPAVPDGAGVSRLVTAMKLDAGASSIDVAWDVESCCGVIDHHLVYGFSADLPATPGAAASVDGSVCGLGASGDFTWTSVPDPAAGDFLWWLVLANDGATTEGSWGVDSAGFERIGPDTGGASGACGVASKDAANQCGR